MIKTGRVPKGFAAWAGKGEKHMNRLSQYIAMNAEVKSGQHKKPYEEPLTLQGFKEGSR